MEEIIFVLTVYYFKSNLNHIPSQLISLHRTKDGAETFAIDLIRTMELDEATYSIDEFPVFE